MNSFTGIDQGFCISDASSATTGHPTVEKQKQMPFGMAGFGMPGFGGFGAVPGIGGMGMPGLGGTPLGGVGGGGGSLGNCYTIFPFKYGGAEDTFIREGKRKARSRLFCLQRLKENDLFNPLDLEN